MLASGILSLVAVTVFGAAPIFRAVGTVAIAMGLTGMVLAEAVARQDAEEGRKEMGRVLSTAMRINFS